MPSPYAFYVTRFNYAGEGTFEIGEGSAWAQMSREIDVR